MRQLSVLTSIFIVFAVGGAGCGSNESPVVDASVDQAAATDGHQPSGATSPAVLLQAGSNGALLLRGTVLTPTEVLNPGEVLISGKLITCVARDCSGASEAQAATRIDTNGIISPGLIDGHNHMSYNFFPKWVPNPPQLFGNRYEWADNPQYKEFKLPYAKHASSNTHFCPGSKWGMLRSAVHGTTTMQGEPSASGSCINWGIREANDYSGLGASHMRGTISNPRDFDDATAQNYLASFSRPVDPITRLHTHMQEGISGNNITEEFTSYTGHDPRPNHHQGVTLLVDGVSILIHSMSLTEEQLQETKATNSKIVWSPSSNIFLYGVTAPIQRILQLGITTGLGPDWTLSGSGDMLSEMRFALAYGRDNDIPELTPQKLWQMATSDGAAVLGFETAIGKLEVGMHADIAVFGRAGPDPYEALIESQASDVRLVLIDGAGFWGDVNFAGDGGSMESLTARNTYCDKLDACGTQKYLCVQDSPTGSNRTNETYADIHTQLYNILEGIGYPADEQYGRGSELLELYYCP